MKEIILFETETFLMKGPLIWGVGALSWCWPDLYSAFLVHLWQRFIVCLVHHRVLFLRQSSTKHDGYSVLLRQITGGLGWVHHSVLHWHETCSLFFMFYHCFSLFYKNALFLGMFLVISHSLKYDNCSYLYISGRRTGPVATLAVVSSVPVRSVLVSYCNLGSKRGCNIK